MAASIRRRGKRSSYLSLSGEKAGHREERMKRKKEKGREKWGCGRRGRAEEGAENSHVARREWLGGFCLLKLPQQRHNPSCHVRLTPSYDPGESVSYAFSLSPPSLSTKFSL